MAREVFAVLVNDRLMPVIGREIMVRREGRFWVITMRVTELSSRKELVFTARTAFIERVEEIIQQWVLDATTGGQADG